MSNNDLGNIDLNKMGMGGSGLSDEHAKLLENATSMLNNNELKTTLNCDDDCIRDKQEKALYDDYLNAKNTYENAPNVLEDTERKFYSFSKGGVWYQNFKEQQSEKTASSLIKYLRTDFTDYLKRIKLMINTFNEQEKYVHHIGDLSSQYEKKVKTINNYKSKIENDSNISNREYTYDADNIVFYKKISKYTFWITFLILILYTGYVFGIKRIYNKKQIVFVILFMIVLFNVNWISKLIISTYENYTKVANEMCELDDYKEL